MTRADFYAVVAAEASLHPTPWTVRNFEDSLGSGHALWVAEDESNLVGYAVTMQVMDEAHLLNVSVLEAWQRAGRGKKIMEYLLAQARKAGAVQMFLEVRAGNEAAQRLYARHGFSVIGRRKGYYALPNAVGQREDAIVMACALSMETH